MSDHGHHSAHSNSHVADTPVNDDDQREDARGALIVFVCLVAFAVHFVSGWTF